MGEDCHRSKLRKLHPVITLQTNSFSFISGKENLSMLVKLCLIVYEPCSAKPGLNPSLNDKTLDRTELKDEKLKFAKMTISIIDTVENTVEKGENAGNQHFLLFPQCFPKPSFLGSLEVGIVW